jgi:hypothetical protein
MLDNMLQQMGPQYAKYAQKAGTSQIKHPGIAPSAHLANRRAKMGHPSARIVMLDNMLQQMAPQYAKYAQQAGISQIKHPGIAASAIALMRCRTTLEHHVRRLK